MTNQIVGSLKCAGCGRVSEKFEVENESDRNSIVRCIFCGAEFNQTWGQIKAEFERRAQQFGDDLLKGAMKKAGWKTR